MKQLGPLEWFLYHPSWLVEKFIQRKADAAVNSLVKSCSRVWQEAFVCEQSTKLTLSQVPSLLTEAHALSWRAIIQQIFHHATHCCYWPLADINQEQHLDQTHLLPWGGTTCRAPGTTVR